MNGGALTNYGSLTINNASTLQCYGAGGVNTFHNAGTFSKQGAGSAQFIVSSTGVAFDNTGSVSVQGGTLEIRSGGSTSQPMDIGPAGTLLFSGSFTYNPGAAITGTGTLTFTSGTHPFAAGQFNPAGTVNFTGGTITLNNSFTPASLGAVGATVTLNVAQSFNDLTLTGTLTGPGDITVAGTFNWSGGTLSGSGRTTIANGATLNLDTTAHQLNRALENNGTANWTAGALQMNGGALTNYNSFTINNPSLVRCLGTGGGQHVSQCRRFHQARRRLGPVHCQQHWGGLRQYRQRQRAGRNSRV
jgi:hypothetical protein